MVTVETPASPTTRGLRLGTAGLIGLIAALWGTPYLLIAVAVREVAPIVVVAARCATAAVVLLAIAGGMGVLRVERRHWPWVALLALLEFVVPFTLISIGEQSLPSSLTGILVASAPLLVAGLAPLFDHTEAPRGTRGLGLVAGFAGVVTVMGLDVADASPVGGVLVIVATSSYVLAAFVLKLKLADAHPLTVIGVATGLAAVLTAVPALSALPAQPPSAAAVGSLLALGLGCTAAGFTLFVVLNSRFGPGRASVVAYLAPGFSTVLGVTVLDEPLGAATVIGLGLILVGSWLAARAGSPAPVPAARSVGGELSAACGDVQ